MAMICTEMNQYLSAKCREEKVLKLIALKMVSPEFCANGVEVWQ